MAARRGLLIEGQSVGGGKVFDKKGTPRGGVWSGLPLGGASEMDEGTRKSGGRRYSAGGFRVPSSGKGGLSRRVGSVGFGLVWWPAYSMASIITASWSFTYI